MKKPRKQMMNTVVMPKACCAILLMVKAEIL